MSADEIWVPNLICTTWLNKEDEPQNGRRLHLAAPGAPRWFPGFGMYVAGISVPWASLPGETTTIRWKEKRLTLPHLDTGPWSTRNHFLRDHQRPRAEMLKGHWVGWNENREEWELEYGDRKHWKCCNGAAFDLTPAAEAELTGMSAEECFRSSQTLIVEALQP